jgi:hypothetical protein
VKRFLATAAIIVAFITGLTMAKAQDSGAQADGVNGKWHFVLDTTGGDREVDAEFSVDADGKVTGAFGNASVAGTYKDGKLDLDFPFTSDEVGETAQMKILGKLDDPAALTGNWKFSTYDGSFKAARPKK